MERQHIGNIELGIDGSDVYYRVELSEAEMVSAEESSQTLVDFVYAQLAQAGFSAATVAAIPHREASFIVIVHLRNDC